MKDYFVFICNPSDYIHTVNGNWGEWSDYGDCSRSCDTGQQTRTRQCNNPPAVNGGQDCVGDDTEVMDCNTWDCSGEFLPLWI